MLLYQNATFKFDPLPLTYWVARDVKVVILFRIWAAVLFVAIVRIQVRACGMFDGLCAATWHLNGFIWD